jgi:hypothetical protein
MKQEWCPQHTSNLQNLSSMRYVYSIAAPKLPGRTFATHEDISGKPRFGTDGWYKLSDGGSRDSHLERYLAVAEDARLVVDTADGPKYRTVAKGGVVLAEARGGGAWRVSVPIAVDALKDVDDAEPPARDGDPPYRSHPSSAADAT